MVTHTKVICTIGPSCNSLKTIIALMQSGMDVARLNFSHGTHEEHAEIFRLLKEARTQLNRPLSIMLDTKGPELRIGKIDQGMLTLAPGQRWLLVKETVVGNAERVSLTPPKILDDLAEGMRVLFDDGYISSIVIQKTNEGVVVEIENGGVIRSGKGVNVPNVNLSLPNITEQDFEDIRFGCQHDVDIIAASFVRSADQVLSIKRLLTAEKKPETLVIAKIENSEGIQNFDSIVQVADGIMIARGDLGVEVPLSRVPKLQKMMIRKSYLAGKPSVTATQMLESMIYNPRPTRAEASDVANAIYDGTSAVMLSGETAVGKYPLETVQMMKSIIKEAEGDIDYRQFFELHSKFIYHDVPSAVTLATVKTAYSSNAKAIFAFTSGGSTARLISRLRPHMPIVAMTPNQKCYHQMAINWGVVPILKDGNTSVSEAFTTLSEIALENKLVENGDLVVLTGGTPFGISGTTNMMIVESIGDVLVRGENGSGNKVHGNVAIVLSPDSVKAYNIHDCILVIPKCDESYRTLVAECAGVVLQNHVDDVESEQFLINIAKEYGRTYITRADGAMHVLKEGQLATIDPEKSLVYKGVII